MTSGFFRPLPDLPKPFWRYPISYINYGAWAIEVIYQKNYMFKHIFKKMPYSSAKHQLSIILRIHY